MKVLPIGHFKEYNPSLGCKNPDKTYKPVEFNMNFTGQDKINLLQKKNKNYFQKTQSKHPIRACAACLLASLGILSAIKAVTAPPPSVVTLEIDPYWISDVKSLSLKYGIPEFAIMQYNNIENADGLFELETVQIPSKYDYLQPQIDEWEEKLYKSKGNHNKVFDYGLSLQDIRRKQEIQKETGYMYTDGDFVYIFVDIKSQIPNFSENGKISAKDFAALFDIKKDGTLLEYNDIKIQNSILCDENTLEGYYLENGDLVKIPASKIMKNSIDLLNPIWCR